MPCVQKDSGKPRSNGTDVECHGRGDCAAARARGYGESGGHTVQRLRGKERQSTLALLGSPVPAMYEFQHDGGTNGPGGQEAADFLGPVSDISAQQWASGEADQNALTALMGGGVAGLPSVRSEEMDTEALNQSVAAEVMGVMNRSNQPFPRLDEDDEMD
eukprot:CAMPEP_0196165310 /NCGR_PEP_ID=MMETSP0911-20130528/1254_1 /TAXON_ID=49265 /ORGANISM="Thalassiosira rotula, Strain GSO102" /LENGTH=159 /DNA_ID=CAMNT_0041430745 /DNA_START=302 /DNA_END=782 /DNA_ORIENTATION=-